MSVTLEDSLVTERARRWESGRHVEVRAGREVVESGVGSNGPRYSGTETVDARLGE